MSARTFGSRIFRRYDRNDGVAISCHTFSGSAKASAYPSVDNTSVYLFCQRPNLLRSVVKFSSVGVSFHLLQDILDDWQRLGGPTEIVEYPRLKMPACLCPWVERSEAGSLFCDDVFDDRQRLGSSAEIVEHPRQQILASQCVWMEGS